MPSSHRRGHASREEKRNWRGISRQDPVVENPILIFTIRDATVRLATTISKRGYRGTGIATIGQGADTQTLAVSVNLTRSKWRSTLGGTIAIQVTDGPGTSDTPIVITVPEISLSDHRWNNLAVTLQTGKPEEPVRLNMRHGN